MILNAKSLEKPRSIVQRLLFQKWVIQTQDTATKAKPSQLSVQKTLMKGNYCTHCGAEVKEK